MKPVPSPPPRRRRGARGALRRLRNAPRPRFNTPHALLKMMLRFGLELLIES